MQLQTRTFSRPTVKFKCVYGDIKNWKKHFKHVEFKRIPIDLIDFHSFHVSETLVDKRHRAHSDVTQIHKLSTPEE